MKIIIFFVVSLLCLQTVFAQNEKEETAIIDNLYKEDQFYIGSAYNLLINRPNNINQNGFSNSIFLGFIKDMPINERRNVALGLGLGVSSNSYNHNLYLSETNNEITYSVLEVNFSKNKFNLYQIDIPLEVRWRTSTASTYKFWRIYTGFKISYIFADEYKHESFTSGSQKITNNNDLNDFQYGLTLSIGYDNINFNLYYGLNILFSNRVVLEGNTIEMRSMKIGLILYIL